MKLSDQALNPRARHTVAVERTISENSAYQEAEFTDKLICTETQTNLTPKKDNKKLLELAPKQKLSQVIYSIKSNDFIAKIQQQKKQALKKQWMNMRKQHSEKQKQQHKKSQTNNQETKISTNTSNLLNRKVENKGKFNEFELHCIGLTQEKDTKELLQKRQQKRKRSKTQMLIHDYDLEKIGALELLHMKQNAQNMNDSKYVHKNSKDSLLLNGTYSQKFDNKSFVKSDSKQKTYLQQMRQAAQMSFASQNEPRVRHKFSQKSYENQNHKDQQKNHCLSRTRNPVSKTVMVQKIINLRKTFNDKYKRSPKKSLIENSIIQTSFSKPKQASPQCQGSTNPIIPYMSFPVMNLKVARKVTFQQLFQNQKKKMDLLKKYIDKGGVFNSFTNETKNNKPQISNQSQEPTRNLMNLSQLQESKLLFTSENIKDQKYLNYLSHGKNLHRGKVKWSDLQKEEIKNIKSKSKLLPEDLLNIESISTFERSKSLENDLIQHSHQGNQTPQQFVTTYDFDHMNKNLQKPQIKQLRHKYLYSSKRKMSKEEFNKYGISMVEVYGREETNLRKLKLKCQTEIIMEECLQIEKKVPQNWDRMGKTSANFIKANLQRRKTTSLGKKMHEEAKQINKKRNNFEPWQNQVESFCEQDSTYFPD